MRIFCLKQVLYIFGKIFNYEENEHYCQFFLDICTFYRRKWKLDQNHKYVDIFRNLVATLTKIDKFAGTFNTNHLEKFSGPVINIVIIYRPGCKFKFWSVNSSMIILIFIENFSLNFWWKFQAGWAIQWKISAWSVNNHFIKNGKMESGLKLQNCTFVWNKDRYVNDILITNRYEHSLLCEDIFRTIMKPNDNLQTRLKIPNLVRKCVVDYFLCANYMRIEDLDKRKLQWRFWNNCKTWSKVRGWS